MARLSCEFRRLCAALAMLLSANVCLAAAIDEERAAGVKAAWLKNIAGASTWPAQSPGVSATGESPPPIVIGLLGDDPNGVIQALRDRIESKGLIVQGRPLELTEFRLPSGSLELDSLTSQLSKLHLLFLGEDSELDWNRLRPVVMDMPIVTVGEFGGFAVRGGVIELFIDVRDGRVKMIINLSAMKRADVVLSAHILKLKKAVIVLQDEEVAH